MSDPNAVVACPSCGKKNRLPAVASGVPRCAVCQAGLPWVVPADDRSFAEVAEQSKVPVVLDLWAPWCGPCRMVAPALEQVATDLAGRIKVVKVNVDENPRVAGTHGIRSIPALKLFRGPLLLDQQTGALGKDSLDLWIDRFV